MCHLEHASTPVDGRGGGEATLARWRNGGVPQRAVLFVLYVVFVVFVLSTARSLPAPGLGVTGAMHDRLVSQRAVNAARSARGGSPPALRDLSDLQLRIFAWRRLC